MRRSEANDAWKDSFLEKIEQQLTNEEAAVFFSILQGFAQTRENVKANIEKVANDIARGKISYWGQMHSVNSSLFENVNFMDKKWEALAREAMQGLHGQAKIHPNSLRFADSTEKAFAAQAMMETVRKGALGRYYDQSRN